MRPNSCLHRRKREKKKQGQKDKRRRDNQGTAGMIQGQKLERFFFVAKKLVYIARGNKTQSGSGFLSLCYPLSSLHTRGVSLKQESLTSNLSMGSSC